MPAKRSQTRTRVLVEQASGVELTKKGSKNSLEIKVYRGKDFLGTLNMGKGSVQWWPGGAKTRSLRKTWTAFAAILEAHMCRS